MLGRRLQHLLERGLVFSNPDLQTFEHFELLALKKTGRIGKLEFALAPLFPTYPNKLSKSLCDPTQNQWISSPFLRPTARYFAEILTDQISFVPDNFLKRREGWSGEDSKSLYACLASLRTMESKH